MDQQLSVSITAVTVDLLRVPLAQSYSAAGKTIGDYWHVLSRIRTSDGIEGFGYVVLLDGSLVGPLAHATRELGQLLIGTADFAPEAAWARLSRAARWAGPGGLVNYAIASLDIALWDAAGKRAGLPLYRLLGGARDRVPAYASDGLWYSLSLDELAASAQRHVADGFAALKLRIGHERSPQGEVQRVRTVREAVGEDVRILVDATETWEVNQALQTGRALEEVGIAWLEDPIDHGDVEGLSRMNSLLRVPIATGEHLYTIGEFAHLFHARGTGVAIIDLARIGGITPWRHVASLAHAMHIPVCGHVIPEIHVHLLAAIPNGHLVEYVPRSERILQGMPALEGGALVAPDAPGLGLSLDQDAVRRYTT
jgi:L-alanine-DL-glutamate epimerase-like enolase superfamily enzyme